MKEAIPTVLYSVSRSFIAHQWHHAPGQQFYFRLLHSSLLLHAGKLVDTSDMNGRLFRAYTLHGTCAI